MKKILAATILATLVSASPVWASSEAVAAETNITQAEDVLQIASQGMHAMHDIRMARGAIFEGQPAAASKFTEEAAKLLSEDSTDWKKYVKADPSAKMVNGQYVVINASVGLSEDYIATPEKTAAIKDANKKLANGDKKGALETLKLAGVSVMQSQYLMPLESTRGSVEKAKKLITDGKYYEANLVLKGAEDGIIVTNEGVIEGY